MLSSLTSTALPLPQKDIDTDMIIPAIYLTSVSAKGYGKNLFRRQRDSEPDFPLNQKKFKKAKILVARENFGCGSSREHAAWALLQYGFRVIIAPSFADIFTQNSGKNGLVLVRIPHDIVEEILFKSIHGDYQLTVDLKTQTVTLPTGKKIEFPFDPFQKECILNGYDDLDYLLSHHAEIKTFQLKRSKEFCYTTRQYK